MNSFYFNAKHLLIFPQYNDHFNCWQRGVNTITDIDRLDLMIECFYNEEKEFFDAWKSACIVADNAIKEMMK